MRSKVKFGTMNKNINMNLGDNEVIKRLNGGRERGSVRVLSKNTTIRIEPVSNIYRNSIRKLRSIDSKRGYTIRKEE